MSTKDFKMTDRDRLAQGCFQGYVQTLFLSFDQEDCDLNKWLSDPQGAMQAAKAAYIMADALIHESRKEPNPPRKEGPKGVINP